MTEKTLTAGKNNQTKEVKVWYNNFLFTSNDALVKESAGEQVYNRVIDNWSLGSDVTTYYALKVDDFEVAYLTSDMLNRCDYAYNTRCNNFTGLPVGPICSPSLDSLVSTLEHDNHNYYYFVGDCSGRTHLTKTLSEHNNIINKLKRENNWCA